MSLRKSVLGVLLLVFTIYITATASFAGEEKNTTPHNGKYYFEVMKSSIIEVVEENQELINLNVDGSVKNKHLRVQNIYRKIYDTFKKTIYADFSLESLESEYDPEKIASVLATQLLAGRVIIAKHQNLFNVEANDSPAKSKKFIPAVFGKLVSAKIGKKAGVEIKQTTLGKGEYKARNPYNQPDEWESKSLLQLAGSDWEKNVGIGEVIAKKYRYLKPIYIKEACLVCHGRPVGEKGPYGHPKEGYEIGEVRGGVSITIQLK